MREDPSEVSSLNLLVELIINYFNNATEIVQRQPQVAVDHSQLLIMASEAACGSTLPYTPTPT